MARALILSLFAATNLSAQEEPPKPTRFHMLLKQLEGTWDASVKVYVDPAKEPVTSKGTMKSRMTAGDLWLIQDYEGEMMGHPFTGHGFLGYDTKKSKAVSAWIDSWLTSISFTEGSINEGKRTILLIGEEEADGGKKVKRKEFFQIVDDNTHRMEMSIEGDDGKEVKIMEIEFKRRK